MQTDLLHLGGAVLCGAVRCGAVRCGAVRCGEVRDGALRCIAVRCPPDVVSSFVAPLHQLDQCSDASCTSESLYADSGGRESLDSPVVNDTHLHIHIQTSIE
jgi:hypothetical protein